MSAVKKVAEVAKGLIGRVCGYSEDGRKEIPDSRPIEVPAAFKRPESTEERIQRIIRTTISQTAAARGGETIEDAYDFEIEDDAAEARVSDAELMGIDIPASARANKKSKGDDGTDAGGSGDADSDAEGAKPRSGGKRVGPKKVVQETPADDSDDED